MQNTGSMITLVSREVTAKDRSSDDHRARRRARIVIELVLTINVPTAGNDPCPLSGQLDLRFSRFDF